MHDSKDPKLAPTSIRSMSSISQYFDPVGPGSFGIRLLDNHGNIYNGWARCFDRGGPLQLTASP